MLAVRKPLLTLALLACFTRAAQAGPPFQTDDPEPTGYRQWEIYVFGKYRNGPATASGALPALELNYGLMPNVQVSFTSPLAFAHLPQNGTRFGYGDTDFGVKVRFLQETEASPQVSFYPSVSIPTGQGPLGAGAVSTYLPLWAEKSWGKWMAHGGAGWLHPTGAGSRNSLFSGVVVLDQTSDRLAIGGELFHQTAQTLSATATTGFNVGVIAAAGSTHNVLFSIGRGLGAKPSLTAYGAYELELGQRAQASPAPPRR